MPCEKINLGGGGGAIVCTRGRHRNCETPGCRKEGTKLCDYTVTGNGRPGTCDRRMCDSCATRVGANRDWCPPHIRWTEIKEQERDAVQGVAAFLSWGAR